jgi:hypothetical protein
MDMTAKLKEKVVRKTTLFLVVLLTLALGSSVVWGMEPSMDGIFIQLGKGKPGHTVTREEVLSQATPTFLAELDSVRAHKLRIVVICCTDPTKYEVLQIFENDPRFKNQGIDWEAQNLDWDGGTNGAREATANMLLEEYLGIDPSKVDIQYIHQRSKKFGDRYINIYCDERLPGNEPTERVIERVVTERVIEKPTETILVDCESHDLTLSLMGGLRTTDFTVAPTAEVTLSLNNQWLMQGWGMHSLFLRNERDTFAPDTETLDQGAGIRVGTRAYKSLWVLGGTFIEENVLTDTSYAGKRPWWRTGADLSIALRRDHFALTASGIYGHEWDYMNGLETNTAIRLAAVFGNTWRLK